MRNQAPQLQGLILNLARVRSGTGQGYPAAGASKSHTIRPVVHANMNRTERAVHEQA